MRRNIKLTIEYDGTDYQGWQRQLNTRETLQEIIEEVLRGILQKKVSLIVSGRTDAGVHARGQVANFKTYTKIPLKKLKRALNSLLPDDIVVTRAQDIAWDFHARFAAKTKIYRYAIINQKYPSVFWRKFAYFVPFKLDFRLMQKEARALLGRHDFRCFQAAGRKAKDTVRTIKKIKVTKKGSIIFIDIQANGFLYKMVRNIAGTLIEVGRGRKPQISIKKILNSRNRQFAGPTVASCGLCLLRVQY